MTTRPAGPVRRPGRDRGAADALGLVLIAPATIGLAILVVALGRDVDARAQVRTAAEAAAQAAALERDAPTAAAAADRVARAMLLDADTCAAPTVTTSFPPVPAAGSDVQFGIVRVTVRCAVSDRGVEVIRSRPRTDEVTAIATVDFFRARREP